MKKPAKETPPLVRNLTPEEIEELREDKKRSLQNMREILAKQDQQKTAT